MAGNKKEVDQTIILKHIFINWTCAQWMEKKWLITCQKMCVTYTLGTTKSTQTNQEKWKIDAQELYGVEIDYESDWLKGINICCTLLTALINFSVRVFLTVWLWNAKNMKPFNDLSFCVHVVSCHLTLCVFFLPSYTIKSNHCEWLS